MQNWATLEEPSCRKNDSLTIKVFLSSTISSEGQITIPLEVRQRLGLQEGDRVEFIVEQGRAVIRPARQIENPFCKYAGVLAAFSTNEEINAWVRDLRDEGNEAN